MVTRPASLGAQELGVAGPICRQLSLENTGYFAPGVSRTGSRAIPVHLSSFVTCFHTDYLSCHHNDPVKHLTYKETGSERLSDKPTVTQPSGNRE